MLTKLFRTTLLCFSQRKNTIRSTDVNLNAINGEMIEVRELTHIDSNSAVGSYTYIGRNCAITKSSIGQYCSIANNVSIGQGEHELDKISTSSLFYNNAYEVLTAKKCVIGNDVWVGVDAIILRGVEIGDGAVIGANSVVTKDIPAFSVAVGSPAKVIKFRFNEKKIEMIKKSQWWNETPVNAKELFKELDKI